jgi:hypothetical protein
MSRGMLFTTGIARTGGGLLAHILSAHPEVRCARNPYLTLFKSLRDAIARDLGPGLAAEVAASEPISDHYFSASGLALLDAIQGSDLEVPFDERGWDEFLGLSRARAELEAADLAVHLERLRAHTYKEMIQNAVDAVATIRGPGRELAWAGFHEQWIIEFFVPLARAFHDARFIGIVRDPRAVVASFRGMARTDPTQDVHALSLVRHWRKLVACATQCKTDPELSDKCLFIDYESLVTGPYDGIKKLCAFLDVPFDDRMVDAGNFIDPASGRPWRGNSSFEEDLSTIAATGVARWREELDEDCIAAVELLAQHEMERLGYETTTGPGSRESVERATAYLFHESGRYSNWRTDLGDPVQDLGVEMLRRALLEGHLPAAPEALVRGCFLFESAFDYLTTPSNEVQELLWT